MLNRLVFLVALVLVAPLTSANDEVSDQARDWFIAEYAPLWASMESVDPVEIKKHWVEDFRDHPVDVESRTVENSVEQWQSTIERYLNDGVQDSILLEVKQRESMIWLSCFVRAGKMIHRSAPMTLVFATPTLSASLRKPGRLPTPSQPTVKGTESLFRLPSS